MRSARTSSSVWEGRAARQFDGAFMDARSMSELGIWRWDLSSGRVELSERLTEILGLSPEAFAGTLDAFLDLTHPEDRDRVWSELKLAMLERRPLSWEARFTHPDGGERILACQGSPSDSPAGLEMVGVCHDITSRVSAESAIGQLERRLSHIIAESPALISIKDLDRRYRMINHQVAALAGLPMDEVIGHTAAEVFPVIGPHIDAQAADALSTQETLHSDVQADLDGVPRTFHLISFALRDHTGAPVEVCCIATDVTEARQQEEESRLRRESTALIGSALRENRLIAARQPVTDITGTRTVSDELLVRMRLPGEQGILQPCAFLPVAERFNLVQQIDTWMVLQALELVGERHVQVNLSAVTFSDREARKTIVAALELMPEAAQRIVFEITETAAAHHLDAAGDFAAALTEMGCGLALDDFGTGFGSFTYLRRLPLRYLKIDRSFVIGLPESPHDRKVVSSIIGIARQFELMTIAEGVEDARTLEILAELGADYAQGFHLGRPRF